MISSCSCNLDNSYCFDIYGCLDNSLILKAELTPGNIYTAYIEDHFGSLFVSTEITANVSGDLEIDINDYPAGLISIVSENLLLFVTESGGNEPPIKMTLGPDGEEYDNILLKFHGGDATINTIQ